VAAEQRYYRSDYGIPSFGLSISRKNIGCSENCKLAVKNASKPIFLVQKSKFFTFLKLDTLTDVSPHAIYNIY
jgi:hypothetical protein